jgi:DNA-3-methyladenine glycosylase
VKPLPRSFYLRPTLEVARNLLGKKIIRFINKKILIGRIVEVEAYRYCDPASHAFHGKTDRNSVMFSEGGHLYVYFTYGMHYCANVVTGKEGLGEAILIRAVEPLAGIDLMQKNRFLLLQEDLSSVLHSYKYHKYSAKIKTKNIADIVVRNLKSLINLTNGPAKFCEAFNITRKHNGIDLLKDEIFITDSEAVKYFQIKSLHPEATPSQIWHNSHKRNFTIGRSSRIGIREGREKPWRFFIKDNPWVSHKK